MVVEADQPPPLPTEALNGRLADLFEQDGATPAGLALGLQKLFDDLVQDWAGDRLSTDSTDAARLVDWLVHNPLFTPAVRGDQPWQVAAREWLGEREQLRQSIKPEMHLAMAMLDGTPLDEHVLIRGNTTSPGEVVPRRFLEAIAGRESARDHCRQRAVRDWPNGCSTRRSVHHARRSSIDCGSICSVEGLCRRLITLACSAKADASELLDYLADRLPREGWSLKRMIKLLAMSRSYQMASGSSDAQAESLDPKNLLLHRMPLRRLEAESIRDAMLAVSGTLKTKWRPERAGLSGRCSLEGEADPSAARSMALARRSIYIGRAAQLSAVDDAGLRHADSVSPRSVYAACRMCRPSR